MSDHINVIIPNLLYLGDSVVASNRTWLVAHNIQVCYEEKGEKKDGEQSERCVETYVPLLGDRERGRGGRRDHEPRGAGGAVSVLQSG